MRKVKRIIRILPLLCALVLFCGCSKESAAGYYKSGLGCFENGNYKEAAGYFKLALEKKSDKAEYYVAYGMALTMLNDFEHAQEQFDKGILDKKNSIVFKNNKNAFRGKGICYLRSGDAKQAAEYLEKALEIEAEESMNGDIRGYLSDAYISLGDYENALKVLTQALEEEESAWLYQKRGSVYLIAKEEKKALEDYKKADKKEESLAAKYGLYQAYTALGDQKGALEALSSALEMEAETDEEDYLLGKIHYHYGNRKKAIDILEHLKEKYPMAGYEIGIIKLKNEEYQDAASYIEDYINSGAKISAEVYRNLGICYEQMGEKEKAVSVYETGMNTDNSQDSADMAYCAVVLAEESKDFDRAYELAGAYLKKHPEDEKMKQELVFLETRTTSFAQMQLEDSEVSWENQEE